MNDQACQLLRRLIRDYGIDLVNQPQRLNALLKDYAQGQFKREIFLCVQAVHEGVVTDLLNNQHLPLEALTARLTHQLQEDCGIDEQAADWAIDSWLIALGISLRACPKPPITQTPVTSAILPTPPVSTTNYSSLPNNYPIAQPIPTDADDFTPLIEDGIAWFKSLFGHHSHYVNNGDGTVNDTRTGLQWLRFSLGQYWNGNSVEGKAIECTLQEALDHIRQINQTGGLCGYNDWRMPSWDELKSIRGNSNEVIDRKVFPNTPDSRFWTITESKNLDLSTSHEKRFYTVNFNRFNAHYAFGTALAHGIKYTRLVR